MAPKKQETTSEKIKDFPLIRGGVCDFCGVSVKECSHYKDIFYRGEFRCLCGGHANLSTFNQSIYKYISEWGAWICNSEGCRRQAQARGGFAIPEVLNFFFNF